METKEREIGDLSYSQMTCYIDCPKKWYEQYVLKHWPVKKEQPLCFGIAFHAGMQRMCESWVLDQDKALENAKSELRVSYSLGKDAGPDPDKWIPKGEHLLTAMAEFLALNRFVPSADGIERKCTKPGFKGFVDCYAIFNGKRTIIDWKTSSYPYSRDKIETDRQLTAYGWMLPGKWDQMAFCVINKYNQEVYWYPTTRTEEQIAEFEAEVTRIRRELETKTNFPGVHTKETCRAWNRQCHLWELGYCNGLEDF